MTAIIVFSSLAFAAAFVIAWMISPSLRKQIEQPKHRFQDSVQDHDRHFDRRNQEGQSDREGTK